MREARRLLGLTQGQLAKLASIPSHIVAEFERTGRNPRARSGKDRMAKASTALERAGVVFGAEGSVAL